MNDSWEEIIIVGYGNHAKTKLIPAIERTCISKISILTSKDLCISQYKIYNSLEKALVKSSTKLFVICNPPEFHYKYSKKILETGFDIFIEKPGFINNENLIEIIKTAREKELVVNEMLMYIENDIFNETVNIINKNINNIKSIYTCFNLPEYPIKTYRNENNFASSLLSDIGCYPLSFISNIELNIKDFKLKDNFLPIAEPLYEINLKNDKFDINIYLGINKIYTNLLRILFKNNDFVEYSPFYYGRRHYKNIINSTNNKLLIYKKYEANAYEKLFSKPRKEYIKTQELRFKKMFRTLELLNNLRDEWLSIVNHKLKN